MESKLITSFQRLNGWRLWTLITFVIILVVEVLMAMIDLWYKGELTNYSMFSALAVSCFVAPLTVYSLNILLRELAHNQQLNLIFHAQHAEKRLDIAIENSQMIIWELDLVRSELHYDETSLKLLNLLTDHPPHSIQDWLAAVHPDDKASFTEQFQIALQAENPVFNLEYRIASREKGWGWVQTRGQVIQRDAVGNPQLAVGSTINITARKQAEMDVIESKERFEILFNNNPELMVISGLPGGLITDVNDAFCRRTGYTREEAVGRSPLALGLWSRAEDQQKMVDAISKDGYCRNVEFEFTLKDGTKRTSAFSAVVAQMHGVPHLISTAHDITDMRLAQTEMIATRNKLAATLDALPDLLFEMDIHGMICDYHASNHDLLAAPPELFLGKTIAEVLPPDVVMVGMASIQEASTQGRSVGNIYQLQMPDGVHWYEFSVQRQPIETGQEQRFTALAHDITSQKVAEQQLRSSETLLRATLESTDEGILMIGSQGKVLSANQRFMELWHVPQELAAKGQDDLLIAHVLDQLVDPDVFLNLVKRLYGTDEESRDSLHFKDGRVFARFTRALSIGNERGRIWCFKDITEQTKSAVALSESIGLLQTVINTTPIRIFWKDKALRYLGCNTAFARDAGMATPQDIIGKDDHQMGWKEQAEIYRADDRTVMDSGIPKLSFDEPQTTPNGNTIWLRTSKVPLYNESKETIGLLGIYEDITERKLDEEAVRNSELKLNSILDNVDAFIYLKDADGRYLFANKPVRELWHAEMQDIVGYSDEKFFDAATATNIHSNDARVLEAGETVRAEETNSVPATGETKTYLSTKLPLRREDGSIYALCGISTDITERKNAELVLAESESRFREIFNSVTDAIFIHDFETGRILDINQRMCEMFKCTHEEALACSIEELSEGITPYSSAESKAFLGKACREGPQTFEWMARARDGRLFWTEVNLRFALIGSHERILAVVHDITERKRAEAELVQRESYQRALLDNFPFMVWLKDADGRFLSVNQKFADACGQTSAIQLTGKSDMDIWPHDLAESYRADDQTVIEGKRAKNVEESIEVDGLRHWHETYKSPVFVDGNVTGTVGFARDITERKQIDIALRRESEKNLALLRNASDGIHILDTEGNVIEASDSFCSMLGYRREEIIGKNVSLWDASFSPDGLKKVVADQFAAHVRVQFETRHRRNDRTLIDVEISGYPLELNGKPALFNSSRDITQRKLTEAALQQQLVFSNALNRISRTLVEIHDPDQIIQDTVQIIGATLDVDRALIYDISFDKHLVTGLSEWLNPQQDGVTSSIGTYPLDVFIGGAITLQRTRTWFKSDRENINPVLVADGSGELLHHKLQIQSLLWYPFAFRENGFFALVLNQVRTHREWTQAEIDFLDSVSQLVNVEFEQIRLLRARKIIEDELKQTKERYDFATKIGKVGTWDWSPVTGNLVWSDETYRLMGFDPGSITPTLELYQGLVHPDDRDAFLTAVQASLQQKIPFSFDCRFVHGNGKEIFCHATGRVEFDVNDQPTRMLGTIQDITERKQTEERANNLASMIRLISDNVPDMIWAKDLNKRFIFANKAVCEGLLNAVDTDEPIGKDDMFFASRERNSHPDNPEWHTFGELCQDSDAITLDNRQSSQFDEFGKVQGKFLFLDVHKAPFVNYNGEVIGVVGSARDVTEKKEAEEKLQLASMVLQNSSEALLVTDATDCIVDINPAFTKMTGYVLEEVIGKNPKILQSGRHDNNFYRHMFDVLELTGQWQGEIWNRRKNGEIYAEWLTINSIHHADGTLHRRVALFSDITEMKKAEELIWNQANYDHLTNLPNRRMFRDRLSQGIKKSYRAGEKLALLILDIDHFKEVNDTLGHDLGDALLVEAGLRISACVRESDTVARLGGDEFTIVLTDLEDNSSVERVAEEIIQSINQPFNLNGNLAYVSASIGITLYPDDATELEEMIKNADQAMYVSKRAGRNRFSYFTNAMQQIAMHRLQIMSDMRTAVADKQFQLYYQPIVESATGKIHKAEALLRWFHPTRGMISPAEFIPLAEESGLIHEIGEFVFSESAKQVKCWRSLYGDDFQISVNISPVQIQMKNNLNEWLHRLGSMGLSGNNFVFEITEGLLLDSTPIVTNQLLAFRDAGVQVAIDDFGTGYSALSYLKKLDIDYLKIDQSFIRNLAPESSDMALCEAIIVMAHKLGLKVIAEGVETHEQNRLLATIGCDYVQGYFNSKPIPAQQFESFMQQR